jgi:hypothetical protein
MNLRQDDVVVRMKHCGKFLSQLVYHKEMRSSINGIMKLKIVALLIRYLDAYTDGGKSRLLWLHLLNGIILKNEFTLSLCGFQTCVIINDGKKA